MLDCKHVLTNLVFAVLSIIFCSNVFAQDISQIRYGNESGLPSQEVYSITVDKQGYIWAGTAYGLARFDGLRFSSYQYEGQKGTSFSGFISDQFGRTWVHNFVGQIVCIDNEEIELLEAYDSSIQNTYAYFAIVQDSILFAQGKRGLYKAIIKERLDAMEFEIVSEEIQGAFIISSTDWGLIAANTTNNFLSIEPSNLVVKKLRLPSLVTYRSGAFVDKNNQLIVVFNSPKSVYRLMSLTEKAIKDEALTNIVKGIPANINRIKQIGNLVWLLTEQGVYVLDENLKRLKWPILKGLNCTDILIDRDNHYWISTLTDGVIKIPSFEMETFTEKNSKLSESKISTLFRRENDLYIGTSNGNLQRFSIQKNEFDAPIIKLPFPIQYITVSPESDKILFQSNNKLFVSNTKGIIQTVSSNRAIKMIDWISNQHYGIAETGISKLNQLENLPKWVVEIIERNQIDNIPLGVLWKGNSTAVLNDENQKKLWIGGRYGLFSLSIDGIKEYRNPKSDSPILPSKILKAEDSSIWIGTLSGELFVIKDNVFKMYAESNGVVRGSTVRVLTESEEGVWLATNLGIQRWKGSFDDSTNEYESTQNDWDYFDQSDGLISNEITGLSSYNGKLFLSTLNGLQVLNEETFTSKMNKPTISINSFLVNGKERELDWVELPHDSNRVQIDVSGVSLASVSSMKIAYRMLPITDQWITETTNQLSTQFFDLKAGDYVFQVKSINKNGDESNEIKELRFRVLKPIWFRWWFLLFDVFILLVSLYLFEQYRIRKQREADMQEQARVRMEDQLKISRLSAIQAQMNPHFMYNALNSIQHFIFANDKRSSNRFLGKFADLMRLIMNHSAMERISLNEELDTIRAYLDLEKMRLDDVFDYKIHIPESFDLENSFIPPLIIQPYLENCIKHGFQHLDWAGKISIDIQIEEESVVKLRIEDNGIGRTKALELSASKSHTSFSTKANQSRLELLKSLYGSSIRVEYIDKNESLEHKTGTIVYLYLPLIEA